MTVSEGGSTESLRDLHALRAWLKTQPRSNAVKVIEAYLHLAINHFTASPGSSIESFREPWSRIQGISKSKGDPIGATGLSQFVKLKTLWSWFDAHSEEYRQHCQAVEARPLIFVEHAGRPNRYGFCSDGDKAEADRPFVIEGAVLKWRREPVPSEQLTFIGKLFYPDGIFTYSGWRYALVILSAIIQVIAFVGSGLLAIASLAFTLNGRPNMGIETFCLVVMSWSIYWFGLRPTVREADLRTSPAKSGTTKRGGTAWVDRINVNLGREKDDPQYRHDATPYRQLVRWKADCAICGSPIELKSDTPVIKGLIGCCVESPDEHSFTFDRVTLEGRPLRARPASSS